MPFSRRRSRNNDLNDGLGLQGSRCVLIEAIWLHTFKLIFDGLEQTQHDNDDDGAQIEKGKNIKLSLML